MYDGKPEATVRLPLRVVHLSGSSYFIQSLPPRGHSGLLPTGCPLCKHTDGCLSAAPIGLSEETRGASFLLLVDLAFR